jgi:hypothetical protein
MGNVPDHSFSESAFRQKLSAVREELHELEGRVPAEHAGSLGAILDVTETVLRGLGWQWPEPLSEHDLAFLAAAGAL